LPTTHETVPASFPSALTEGEWRILLSRIRSGRCTPFIGGEAAFGVLPSRSDIARELAIKYNYPLEDSHDLARVAQFLATGDKEHPGDPLLPRMEIVERLRAVPPPDFTDSNEPHRILADLPLAVYATTNYDDLMYKALRHRQRNPRRELCRWNEAIPGEATPLEEPTVANPVVFHIHGYVNIISAQRSEMEESLVLTEDDYLDFLISTSRSPNLIPSHIQSAFAGASLLFLGYRLTDLEFRVLLRSLVGYLNKSIGRPHMSVQIIQVEETVSTEEQNARMAAARAYLSQYCEAAPLHIRVCWTTQTFLTELRQRWETFNGS